MKNFHQKFISIFLIVILFSCQKEYQESTESIVTSREITMACSLVYETPELQLLKSSFKCYIPKMRNFIQNGIEGINTKERSKEIIKFNEMFYDLKSQTIDMLISYGFTNSEIDNLVNGLDQNQVAILGLAFIAIQNYASSDKNYSEKLDKGSDLTYGEVLDCLGRALLGVKISDIVFEFGEKIVITTVMQVAKKAAVRALGVAGAIVAIIDFGDCLGLYDVW